MNVRKVLESVADGSMDVGEALLRIKEEPFTDLGYAKVDHHRAVRQGAAEVVYGAGKTPAQIVGIVESLRGAGNGADCVLITRLAPEAAEEVGASVDLAYHPEARIGIVGRMPEPDGNGTVVVACAGTSDLPVAEEAALTAEALGNKVTRLYDVGVSGLHRVLAHLDDLAQAQVIIAIAGMEGALASVLGGLTSAPVIAVPTSVGYGAAFGGVTALLGMLTSCASGVSVVNIDNGFGAAFQAHQINHLACPAATAQSEEGRAEDSLECLIELDLSQAATRAAITSQLEAAMTPGQKAQWESVCSKIHVGARHCHGIHEVEHAIAALDVPEQVRTSLSGVYKILARAEASVHGTTVEATHFHEVGKGASIENAARICAAFHVLGAPDCKVAATPVQTGSGTVECAHGLMDIPTPATAAIIDAYSIPVCTQKKPGELCTPTSAAIIAHFVGEWRQAE